MHLIQIIRNYLGLSQQELAEKAGITQSDLCEMEIRTPYGRIEKYQRLSEYLGIPIHALVNNDCNLVPLSFFDKHVHADYAKGYAGGIHRVGREGEDAVFNAERERLKLINPSLAHLVLPYYKLRHRPGFDILSFEDDGKPVCIEVKTTTSSESDFVLTKQEYQKANKMTSEGTGYLIYRYTNWGTDAQKLMIYDFADLKKHNEISPCTYVCNTGKREPMVTGIRYHRELCGITKGELAEYLGIQTPHLWRYETGERKCSVEMYQRMAEILNTTIDELLAKNVGKSNKNLSKIDVLWRYNVDETEKTM